MDKTKNAISLVEDVILKIEKQSRLGNPPDKEKGSVSRGVALCSFLFKDDKVYIFPPPIWNDEWDEVIERHNLDQKDIHSIWIRSFAMAMEADAHCFVAEAWVLECCGKCGYKLEANDYDAANPRSVMDDVCPICGSRFGEIAPSQSEYSTEMFNLFLEIKGEEKSYLWLYDILRDEKTKEVVGYEPQAEKEQNELSGRFAHVWSLEAHTAPHILYNLPFVYQLLGKEVPEELTQVIEKAEKMRQKFGGDDYYPIIKFNNEQVVLHLLGSEELSINGKKFTREELLDMILEHKRRIPSSN